MNPGPAPRQSCAQNNILQGCCKCAYRYEQDSCRTSCEQDLRHRTSVWFQANCMRTHNCKLSDSSHDGRNVNVAPRFCSQNQQARSQGADSELTRMLSPISRVSAASPTACLTAAIGICERVQDATAHTARRSLWSRVRQLRGSGSQGYGAPKNKTNSATLIELDALGLDTCRLTTTLQRDSLSISQKPWTDVAKGM